jgi:RNA polymerase sigma-70 factor (ECF subfamily)
VFVYLTRPAHFEASSYVYEMDTDRWICIRSKPLRPCDDNEKALVKTAGSGDVAALARLYERYYAPLVGVAYSVLLDRGLAEDAAQQAFATACRKIHGLRCPDRFGPWLATICRNAAHDMLREKGRRTALEKAAVQEAHGGPTWNGFDRAVREAVDHLPPMYREVVVLHYFHRMSYKEIEPILGITEDVVKGRLARARRQMQVYLEREGFRRRP